jgi:hypothetical protein
MRQRVHEEGRMVNRPKQYRSEVWLARSDTRRVEQPTTRELTP